MSMINFLTQCTHSNIISMVITIKIINEILYILGGTRSLKLVCFTSAPATSSMLLNEARGGPTEQCRCRINMPYSLP